MDDCIANLLPRSLCKEKNKKKSALDPLLARATLRSACLLAVVDTLPGPLPAATFASAALLYADELNVPAAGRGAFVVAIVSTFVVSMVFVRTVYTSLRGELFGRDPVVGVCLKDCH